MASILKVKDQNGNIIDIPAIKGASAYEVAVANGFEGTEEEWLESLKASGTGLTDEQVADLTANTEARHKHSNQLVLDRFILTTNGYLEFRSPSGSQEAVAFSSDVPLELTTGEINSLANGGTPTGYKKYLGENGLKHFADLIKAETLEEVPESSGGGYALDTTLTVSGAAADAKATGDRLFGVEYQTVITEEAYEHKDLPEGEKTVTINGNGVFGDKAYINNGVDLFPRGGFNRTFPWGGLTITQKGDIFKFTGTIASTSSVYFTKDGSNNQYTELPEGIAGTTITLLGFANSLLQNSAFLYVTCYDANKTKLNEATCYLAKTSTQFSKSLDVPENAVYYSVSLYSYAQTMDCEAKLYLVTNAIEEVPLVENSARKDVTNTAFSTLPYSSSVEFKLSLKEYISKYAGGGTVTYLTPEDFGAKGDGATDDSEAIALCIKQASVSKQTVLMAKKYYVTTPIVISENGLNIIANDIVYDGTDTAIKISGQKNTLKIHSVTSGGVGIGFRGDNGKIVRHNDVEINSVESTSHGIVFYNGLMGICQNTIRFNRISAGGVNSCYGICALDTEGDSWIGENNFYGGQISNCEWAVYDVGGNSKFYGIHIEENVQGGFFFDKNAYAQIFHPRIAESMRDGNLPIYKFNRSHYINIYDSSGIHINQIDLSEAITDAPTNSGGVNPLREHQIGKIHGQIIGSNFYDGNNTGNTMVYSDKTYIWGNYLIFTPFMSYRKVVTTPTLDTRLIGTEANEEEAQQLTQLPTKFVVDNVNTEIYLHPSYCAFGFNKFEVEQANGFTCKVHGLRRTQNDEGEYVEETFIIFDGTECGNGTYNFKVYKDCDKCLQHGWGKLQNDFLGHYWEVEKVGLTDDIKAYIDETIVGGAW